MDREGVRYVTARFSGLNRTTKFNGLTAQTSIFFSSQPHLTWSEPGVVIADVCGPDFVYYYLF